MKKVILVILDGLGDLPTPKTPLQAAKIPNLDKLAKKGITGILHPLDKFVIPGSDTSHLAILGYDPDIFYSGRGPLEALGLGIKLNHGDVAFRANFATLEKGIITDRRAGRVDSATSASLVKYLPKKIDDVEIIFKSSVEHRGTLVLRGEGISSNISDTDSHREGKIANCHPLDNSPEARKTANIVNKLTEMAIQALDNAPENKNRQKKANAILLRGAGSYEEVPSFYERFGLLGACIAGGALYRGVASFMGMDIIMVPGSTGDKNTDLNAQAKAAAKATANYDFVFLHIKMCDSFGHDGDFEGKKSALEKIDRIIPILEKTGAALIITGDHSTPVSLKEHSGHGVPILVCGGERYDDVKKFDEISCAKGGLGHIEGKDIIHLILNITGKARKYGS
jgi:2,3-bisphosphoglycerate-independent phosphoglycerate mutase